MSQKSKTLLKAFVVIFAICLLVFNWESISWLFSYRYLKEAFIPQPSPVVSEYNNSIEIPTISITAPIVIAENSNGSLDDELNTGVVLYGGSAFPGEQGQTIILGHSAPLNWPKIKYDWVFSDLNKLEKGDEVVIYFNNKKYIYSVETKTILNIGDDVSYDKTANSLVLISCWPPGKNYKRIAVTAKPL